MANLEPPCRTGEVTGAIDFRPAGRLERAPNNCMGLAAPALDGGAVVAVAAPLAGDAVPSNLTDKADRGSGMGVPPAEYGCVATLAGLWTAAVPLSAGLGVCGVAKAAKATGGGAADRRERLCTALDSAAARSAAGPSLFRRPRGGCPDLREERKQACNEQRIVEDRRGEQRARHCSLTRGHAVRVVPNTAYAVVGQCPRLRAPVPLQGAHRRV